MKYTVKILALTLVSALALSLTGCHMKTPENVVEIEGVQVPAGVYLMNQMQAYSNATGKLEGDEKNVLKATIEEQKGEDWVHAETLRLLRRYVYLEKEFAAQGLSFTEDEKATNAAQAQSNWSGSETLLAANGIGQASYALVYESEVKYEKLFAAFAKENTKNITDEQIKAYMDEIYTHVTTMTLPVTAEDGTALEEAKQKEIANLAEELKGKLAAGGDMQELAVEYLKKAFEICGRTYTEEALTQFMSTTFVTKDYLYFPEELLTQVLDAKVGEAGVYMLSTTPMVYQKIANYANDVEFLSYRETLLNNMNAEAFDAKIEQEAAAYTVTEDAAAVRAYPAKKVKLS